MTEDEFDYTQFDTLDSAPSTDSEDDFDFSQFDNLKESGQRSFSEELGDAWASGWRNMETGVVGTAHMAGVADADTTAAKFLDTLKKRPETPEYFKRFAAIAEREGQDISNAEGVWDTAVETLDAFTQVFYEGVFKNQKALAYGVVESAANSAPAIALTTGGGIAGTAATPGVGTAVGMAAGSALGTFAVEAGAHLQGLVTDKLQEQGINIQDATKDDILNVLHSEEYMDWAESEATKRGLAVAAVEALFAGITGKITGGMAGKTLAQKSSKTLAGLSAETVGESTGEFAGQVVTEGDVNYGDVVLEGALGGGQSSATTATGAILGGVKNKFADGSPLPGDLPTEGDIDPVEFSTPESDPNALPPIPENFEPLPETLEQPPQTVPESWEDRQLLGALDALDTANGKPIEGGDALDTVLGDTTAAESSAAEQEASDNEKVDALVGVINEISGTNDPLIETDEAITEEIDKTETPIKELSDEDLDVLQYDLESQLDDTWDADDTDGTAALIDRVVEIKEEKIARENSPERLEQKLKDTNEKIKKADDDLDMVRKEELQAEATEIQTKLDKANNPEPVVEKAPKETVESLQSSIIDLKVEQQQLIADGDQIAADATGTIIKAQEKRLATLETAEVVAGNSNYSAVISRSSDDRIQVGHFDSKDGTEQFHVLVDGKPALNSKGKPLIYKTIKGADNKANQVANFGLPPLETASSPVADTTTTNTEAAPEIKVPLNKLKLERQVVNNKGETVTMRQTASVAIKNVDKRRETAKQILRCVNG